MLKGTIIKILKEIRKLNRERKVFGKNTNNKTIILKKNNKNKE